METFIGAGGTLVDAITYSGRGVTVIEDRELWDMPIVLFLALLVNATYLMAVRSDDLSKDPRNRRIITATYSRERGAILVGKDAIARSVPAGMSRLPCCGTVVREFPAR